MAFDRRKRIARHRKTLQRLHRRSVRDCDHPARPRADRPGRQRSPAPGARGSVARVLGPDQLRVHRRDLGQPRRDDEAMRQADTLAYAIDLLMLLFVGVLPFDQPAGDPPVGSGRGGRGCYLRGERAPGVTLAEPARRGFRGASGSRAGPLVLGCSGWRRPAPSGNGASGRPRFHATPRRLPDPSRATAPPRTPGSITGASPRRRRERAAASVVTSSVVTSPVGASLVGTSPVGASLVWTSPVVTSPVGPALAGPSSVGASSIDVAACADSGARRLPSSRGNGHPP